MRFSERVKTIEPYTAGEQAAGFIKLNTNENPYPPSPRVQEVLRAFDADRLRLYPPLPCRALVEAIAAYEGVDPDCVFVGNGSDEVLAFAFAALYDGPVEFPDITYSFYPVYCKLFGVSYKIIPVKSDFTVDFDAFTASGGAVITNPNAPTALGCAVEQIARLAEKTDRVVLVDEAYGDFAFAPSAVKLLDTHPNVAVVKTLSKSYSLAGIRCGYMIADPAVIRAVTAVKDSFNSYPVDSVCQAVAIAAIEDVAYRNTTVGKVVATRERIQGELRRRGVFCTDSETNFLFMAGSRALYEAFKENGILVRHFDTPKLKNYLRVTVGTDADMDTFLTVFDRIRGEL